jgi:hypothetical protein
LVEGYIFTNFNSIALEFTARKLISSSHRLNIQNTICIILLQFWKYWLRYKKTQLLMDFISKYSTSERLNLDAENENLNGNLYYSKVSKYYKLTAGINANWNKKFCS